MVKCLSFKMMASNLSAVNDPQLKIEKKHERSGASMALTLSTYHVMGEAAVVLGDKRVMGGIEHACGVLVSLKYCSYGVRKHSTQQIEHAAKLLCLV